MCCCCCLATNQNSHRHPHCESDSAGLQWQWRGFDSFMFQNVFKNSFGFSAVWKSWEKLDSAFPSLHIAMQGLSMELIFPSCIQCSSIFYPYLVCEMLLSVLFVCFLKWCVLHWRTALVVLLSSKSCFPIFLSPVSLDVCESKWIWGRWERLWHTEED